MEILRTLFMVILSVLGTLLYIIICYILAWFLTHVFRKIRLFRNIIEDANEESFNKF